MLLLLVLALMVVTHSRFEMPLIVPGELRRAAVAFVLLGLTLAVAARVQFARARTTLHTFAQPEQLVTSGLFRFSRNPMYLGLSSSPSAPA